jgi:hypothetical protein
MGKKICGELAAGWVPEAIGGITRWGYKGGYSLLHFII